MEFEEKKLIELTFYCYTRLKTDELGLTEFEGLTSNSTYEPYYLALAIESELLYRPLDDVIPLRCEWDKAQRDFQKYTKSYLSELNVQVSWAGMVAVMTITKMFVRRYRAVNPLFASRFCVEMLDLMNELGKDRAITLWLAWKKVIRCHKESKKSKRVKVDSFCDKCLTTLSTIIICTIGVAGVIKLVEVCT